jgi:hypothetical protein
MNMEDSGKWPFPLADNQRMFLVANGLVRITIDDIQFPANKAGRRFSTFHYKRIMPNGEVVNRRWLAYSTSTDSVYCFCCKLFASSNIKFSNAGCSNWHHLSHLISEHETSVKHMEAYLLWIDTEVRLSKDEFVDKELRRQIEAEKSPWRGILERLLAAWHLALRGSSDRLFHHQNGNF